MLFRILRDDVQDYFKRRMSRYFTILTLISLILVGRLIYLQVVMYEYYGRLSDNNRIRIMSTPAERGFIKSKNGYILVKNTPSYQLEVVKEDTKNLNGLLKQVSETITIDITKAKQKIKKSYYYQPTTIARGLTFDQVAFFLEHSEDYQGLQIGLESVRSYRDGRALSHILGYMGEVTENELDENEKLVMGDIIGKTGLESLYEDVLRGVSGKRQVEVDSFGRVLEIISEKEAVPGKNLLLTIDYELQSFISKIMAARKGSVVLLDMKDNSVISMVSTPSHDLNLFTPFIIESEWQKMVSDPAKPLLNRAIEGRYPPGSVFKVIMAMAGLRESVVTPETTFNCSGQIHFNNFDYRCWNREGHGEVDIYKAIAESCDVYFYSLGLAMGIDMISDYARRFSLGVRTGVDLPNEKSGVFPNRNWKMTYLKKPWYPGETIITSIGQGYMTTTPIQNAVMLAGIFNGGNIYKPRIVEYIENVEDGSTEYREPELVAQVDITDEIRKVIMEGMVRSVYEKHGTGWRARVKDVHIGGKTGTAQVVSLKKTEDMEDEDIPEFMRDHSWFTAVFPSDAPRYALVVMIEHGGSGGRSSAPVAGAIVNKMLDMGYVERN